jgi:hypothetical protein
MHAAIVAALAVVAVIAYRRGDPLRPFRWPVGLNWLPWVVLPAVLALALNDFVWAAYATFATYLAFCIAWNWNR